MQQNHFFIEEQPLKHPEVPVIQYIKKSKPFKSQTGEEIDFIMEDEIKIKLPFNNSFSFTICGMSKTILGLALLFFMGQVYYAIVLDLLAKK